MPSAQTKIPGKVLGISIAAAVGGFLFGFDSSVINGAVDALSGPESGFDLSPAMTGVAVSSALFGCTIGAIFAGRTADRFGRVKVMVIAAVLFAVSSVLSGLAFTVWDLTFWRIVAGMGIGVASVVVPTYIAEVAPAAARGRLGSLQQLAIAFGLFAAFVSDATLAHLAGSPSEPLWFGVAAWRWMLIVGVVPAVIYGLLSIRLPESPRYLVTAGRPDDARKVLAEAVGEPDPDAKLLEIQGSLDSDHRPSFADVRGNAVGLKPIVWVAIAIAFFQQTTGINIILYYGSTLWSTVGFGSGLALVIPVGTSILGIAMTFVAIAIVDRIGRRPMLLVGSAGMAITLAIVAIAFAQGTPGADGAEALPFAWGIVGLISAHVFYIFFCGTWGPVMWVYLGEMFPNQLRGAGMAIAVPVNWIANFLVTLLFPIFIASIGLSFTYVIFAVLTGISFLFVLRKVAETRGVELEDMTDTVQAR